MLVPYQLFLAAILNGCTLKSLFLKMATVVTVAIFLYQKFNSLVNEFEKLYPGVNF